MRIVYLGVVLGLFSVNVNAQETARYVCQDTKSCQQTRWKVMAWLNDNAQFKPRDVNEYLIEAIAKTPAYKNRLEYRVHQKVLSKKGDSEFEIVASCRASLGCVDAGRKLQQLIGYLNAHASGDNQNRIIENFSQKIGCKTDSKIHPLRVSWAGHLFEIECMNDEQGKNMESKVVRCWAGQCKELK